ncbi:MAG TPA: hypothetical protein PKK20_05325, partial [Verrucomicrobiota bacterium]|nr:hypothetical protein [Verrucomicrobiota bacterium]
MKRPAVIPVRTRMVQRASTAAKPKTAQRGKAPTEATGRPRTRGAEERPGRRARSGSVWLALCLLGFGAAEPAAMTTRAGAGSPPPK